MALTGACAPVDRPPLARWFPARPIAAVALRYAPKVATPAPVASAAVFYGANCGFTRMTSRQAKSSSGGSATRTQAVHLKPQPWRWNHPQVLVEHPDGELPDLGGGRGKRFDRGRPNSRRQRCVNRSGDPGGLIA